MIDLHNDALLELPENELLEYLKKSKLQGLTEVWLSVWTTELKNPIEIIKEKKIILDKIKDDKKYPLCKLHIEDAWFLTPENLQEFIKIHPNSVGLTWNYKNCLAGGALSKQSITEFGYEVISELEKANIQIDTAHLNRKSFYQFASVTKRSIVCTHTAFNSVNRHKRNLTDNQIRKIILSGGQIGLCLVPAFLCKKSKNCSYNDIVIHIDYFRKKFGLSNLMLGSDFYGVSKLPNGINEYSDLKYIFNCKVIGYSQLNQPLLAFTIGNPHANKRLLVTGGMHAREWISIFVVNELMMQNSQCPNDVCITYVPICNPDGFILATEGLTKIFNRKRKFLIKVNGGSNDFSFWKANANAVDLNVNFDANWGQGKQNVRVPSPANFIGKTPNSEKETKSLIKLIKTFKPTQSLAFHSKGELVYYSRPEDKDMALELEEVTGYKAELSQGSYGGLTDYLALKLGVPSFTIELGSDGLVHPIGKEHLPEIMSKVKDIIYFLSGA